MRRGGEEMWTFITQLLVTLVLLGFFLVSCQNVLYIVKGSLCFVLKHIHQELDKELGESEGQSDDEETISTRVVRRRVFLKVTPGKRQGRAPPPPGLRVPEESLRGLCGACLVKLRECQLKSGARTRMGEQEGLLGGLLC